MYGRLTFHVLNSACTDLQPREYTFLCSVCACEKDLVADHLFISNRNASTTVVLSLLVKILLVVSTEEILLSVTSSDFGTELFCALIAGDQNVLDGMDDTVLTLYISGIFRTISVVVLLPNDCVVH